MGKAPWQDLIPEAAGSLPGGGVLRRTDPSGPTPAPVAILGVYPALTRKRIVDVDGVRMTLPTEVEGRSFEAGSASGGEIDDNYLHPLGLSRADVFISDLLPYFLANTTKSKSGRSMADNVRMYEQSTGAETGIQSRPTPAKLLKLAADMPGNLDRLGDYLGRCRPRLVLTLGTEPAAFLRGISFAVASKQVDTLLYGSPVGLRFGGVETLMVHLVHPHLFIKRNAKWTARHRAWCQEHGRGLVKHAIEEWRADAAG